MRTYALLDSAGESYCVGTERECERVLWSQLANFYAAAGYVVPKRFGPFRPKVVTPRGGRIDGAGFMREIVFRMVRDDGRECKIRHYVAPIRAVSSDEIRAEYEAARLARLAQAVGA